MIYVDRYCKECREVTNQVINCDEHSDECLGDCDRVTNSYLYVSCCSECNEYNDYNDGKLYDATVV